MADAWAAVISLHITTTSEVGHRHRRLIRASRFGVGVASARDGGHRGHAGRPVAVKPVNGEHLFAVEEVRW